MHMAPTAGHPGQSTGQADLCRFLNSALARQKWTARPGQAMVLSQIWVAPTAEEAQGRASRVRMMQRYEPARFRYNAVQYAAGRPFYRKAICVSHSRKPE